MLPPVIRSRRFLARAALACALAACPSCGKLGEWRDKFATPAAPPRGLHATGGLSPEAAPPIVPPPPPPAAPENTPVNVDAEVSILAYHDLSPSREVSDMVIRPDKFRKQLEALKNSGATVISLSDYLAWKQGKAAIPSPAVVITFDDGWEGVYAEAFPILQEYRFPFSIFLYANYLGGSGRSLSDEQIREMLASGCEIGSHSVSHADMTERGGKPDAAYEAWLRQELAESLRVLREKFGDKVLPVFAYPYGKYNEKILQAARESSYELGVTVWGKRASHDTPDLEVGRYIVHGNDDSNFHFAVNFRGAKASGTGSLAAAIDGSADPRVPVTIWPKDNAVIGTRKPAIVVDVSGLGPLDPDSISMDIGGYGRVPVEFDPASGKISHQVVEPLRDDSCQVRLRLKRRGQAEPDSLTWSFQVDRSALYLHGDAGETAGRYAAPDSRQAGG